jgi:hypothetical protein
MLYFFNSIVSDIVISIFGQSWNGGSNVSAIAYKFWTQSILIFTNMVHLYNLDCYWGSWNDVGHAASWHHR